MSLGFQLEALEAERCCPAACYGWPRTALKVYAPRGRLPKEAVHRHKEVIYRAHDEAIAIVDKAIATHEEAKRKRQLRRCPQATKLGYMRICTLGWYVRDSQRLLLLATG